jgi:DNA polymerase III sliding clamp (beta) subunit (PCNA family)
LTRVVFETSTIADAISKAERVAPSKGNSFDKAAGIVLDIDPDQSILVVKATNLDVFYMEWVGFEKLEGDRVQWRLPSRLLNGILSKLPIGSGQTVEMFDENNTVRIKSGRMSAKINLIDASYFPTWQTFGVDELIVAPDLGAKLSQVEWAASKGTDIPFTGVHFNGEYVVATDRYRFAKVPLLIPQMPRGCTIPAGLITPLLRQQGEIRIGFDGQQLLIMPDDYTQIRTIIYGAEYPSIQKLMNMQWPQKVSVKKADMLTMIERASEMTGSDRFPTLYVYFGLEEIVCMMNNDEIGLLSDVVECPGQITHARHPIKFTPKNLLDAIKNAPSESIDLCYDPENSKRPLYVNGGSGYEAWVAPRGDAAPKQGA